MLAAVVVAVVVVVVVVVFVRNKLSKFLLKAKRECILKIGLKRALDV